jgi:flagellar biosynthesis chaperone FliJ
VSGFRFRLETALVWRRRQLEAEERALEMELAEAARRAGKLEETRQAQKQAERASVRSGSLTGAELVAHSRWRLTLERRTKVLAAEAAAMEPKLAARRARVMEANRRVRLLERLKERRREEWNHHSQRQLDDMAGDAYLARWPPTP